MLDRAGVPHVAVSPGFDDGALTSGKVTPAQWVAALAYLKASAPGPMREGRTRGSLILSADTVCLLDDRIIGQPRDAEHAREILASMGERSHDVLTGVALIDPRTFRRMLFVDRAVVSVGSLKPEWIDDYLASGAWRGKAGAYNLSERLAAGWPIHVVGDPDTVMGLPMRRLLPLLARIEPDTMFTTPRTHS